MTRSLFMVQQIDVDGEWLTVESALTEREAEELKRQGESHGFRMRIRDDSTPRDFESLLLSQY